MGPKYDIKIENSNVGAVAIGNDSKAYGNVGAIPSPLRASDTATLMNEIETVWRHAGSYMPVWRQVTAIPHGAVSIDRSTFATLFPRAALPPQEYRDGFPFVGAVDGKVRIDSSGGWTGIMPSGDEVPEYFWTLKRNGVFVFREMLWESLPNQQPKMGGHVDIVSVLSLAVATTFFLRKLAAECHFDEHLNYTIAIEIEGMEGRGLVMTHDYGYGTIVALGHPPEIWKGSRISASASSTIGQITADPIRVGLDLVGELALLLNRDFAPDEKLRSFLRVSHQRDRSERNRLFGFLDGKEF